MPPRARHASGGSPAQHRPRRARPLLGAVRCRWRQLRRDRPVLVRRPPRRTGAGHASGTWRGTGRTSLLDAFAALAREFTDMCATLPAEQFSALKLTHASAGQVGMLLQVASVRAPSTTRTCAQPRSRWRRSAGDSRRWPAPVPCCARSGVSRPSRACRPPVRTRPTHLPGGAPDPQRERAQPVRQVQVRLHAQGIPRGAGRAIYAWLNRTPDGAPGEFAQSLLQVDSYGGAVNARRVRHARSPAVVDPQAAVPDATGTTTPPRPVDWGPRGLGPSSTWSGSAASSGTSTPPPAAPPIRARRSGPWTAATTTTPTWTSALAPTDASTGTALYFGDQPPAESAQPRGGRRGGGTLASTSPARSRSRRGEASPPR